MSTEEIATLMNQYWLGNIGKATESTYLVCFTCLKFTLRELICSASGYLIYPVDHLRSARRLLYRYCHLVDGNMF